jgi:hypothetical protein
MSGAAGQTAPTSSMRARRSVQPTGRGFAHKSARISLMSTSLKKNLRFEKGGGDYNPARVAPP